MSDTHSNTKELGGVQMLWHSDYWDGPLSGMVRLADGERAWFSADLSKDYPGSQRRRWRRFFWVHRLTAEDLAYEDERHAFFREKVRPDCDYVDGRRADFGTPKPREEQELFYARYPPSRMPRYNDRLTIGWFWR